MRIYIAAPFAARNLAREVAAALIESGHIVTSSWANSTREIDQASIGASAVSSQEEVTQHAQDDLNDIDRAQAVLHLTSSFVQQHLSLPDSWLTTGGRHVEHGYALARGKMVHLLGEPENVFGRAFSRKHESVEGFIAYLSTLGLDLGDDAEPIR